MLLCSSGRPSHLVWRAGGSRLPANPSTYRANYRCWSSQECAGVIRSALECARGFSVLFPRSCKCAQLLAVKRERDDGLVRWSVQE